MDYAEKQYYNAPCGFYNKLSSLHDPAENDCHIYMHYPDGEVVINASVRYWKEVRERLIDEQLMRCTLEVCAHEIMNEKG